MDASQRAEDNERLRRLAAEELAAMRSQLASALADRVELHKDLNALAERLSEQEDRTLEETSRADELQSELAQVRAQLTAAINRPLPSLKRQLLNRVPIRIRKLGRRVLGMGPSGSANAH